MTNKLGLRNRNDALYYQIVKEKELKIFYIGDYDRLRTEIKEERIKKYRGIDVRDFEYNILLFTLDYGVDPRLYPATLDEYLEGNKDIELG